MLLESIGIDNLKNGTLLFSPILCNDENSDLYELKFEVYKFLAFTKIAIEDVKKENDNRFFAKLQALGELPSLSTIYRRVLVEKLAAADKQEAVKKDSTIVYKNIQFGFFEDPVKAVETFAEKLGTLYDFVELEAKKIKLEKLEEEVKANA